METLQQVMYAFYAVLMLAAAGTLVAGMVVLIGLGRTAYKLSQGDTDSMTSLIVAIVGIVLGFLAKTFIV